MITILYTCMPYKCCAYISKYIFLMSYTTLLHKKKIGTEKDYIKGQLYAIDIITFGHTQHVSICIQQTGK